MRKLIAFIIVIVLLVPYPLEQNVDGAEPSIHSTNLWTGKSPYTAITNPELKWHKDLKGVVVHMVIDSKGVIYALSNNYSTYIVKLTAIDSDGTVRWAQDLNMDRAYGLALYGDKSLVVLGTSGIGYSSAGGRPDTVLAKYTTSGEQLWENIYEDTQPNFFSPDISVDSDGSIVFTIISFTLLNKGGSTSENPAYRYELKLIGLTAKGVKKFETVIESEENNAPIEYTTPIFAKGQIFITTSRGYNKKINAKASTNVHENGRLTILSRDGKKIASSTYEGFHYAPPVYYNNRLYVPANENLHIYDMKGKLLQTITAKKVVDTLISPTINKDGRIIFGQQVFNTSGKRLWEFSPLTGHPTSPFLAKNKLIIDNDEKILLTYLDSDKYGKGLHNGVVSFDLNSGKRLWKFPINHVIETPPIIGKDGTVYVAGSKLFAIGQKK